jgi:hypothetical protein
MSSTRIQKADEIFHAISGFATLADWDEDPMFRQLLKDCREMKAESEKGPAGGMMVPRQRTLKGPNRTRFSIRSKILDREPGWEGTRLFMAFHGKLSPFGDVNIRYLMDMFHLSKRETDVVSLRLFRDSKTGKSRKSSTSARLRLKNIFRTSTAKWASTAEPPLSTTY